MKISRYIQTADFCEELPLLNLLLDHAEAKVSFFGDRVIKIVGYSGYIRIDLIAKKVLAIAKKLFDTNMFTLDKRVAGIEITYKLRSLYRDTNELVKNVNGTIKKIIHYKENSTFSFEEIYFTDRGDENIYTCFTKYKEDHLLNEFKFSKKKDRFYPYCYRSYDNGDWVFYMAEKQIRQRFASTLELLENQ